MSLDDKSMRLVRQQLSKQFKTSVASMETLRALSHIPYGVSSQCLSLDMVLGRPGFPAGRLTEVVGLESRGKCVVGDTLIDCPRDLEQYPDGIPIRDLVGQSGFYTYSYSHNLKQFVLRKVKWVRKTRIRAQVYRMVWYDARTHRYGEIIGTPDHPVLLSNGTYTDLVDLQPGDSLRVLRRGYLRSKPYADIIVSPQNREPEHQFIYRELFGDIPQGYLVHHDNHNKLDNSPDNLLLMSKSDHVIHHNTERPVSLLTRQRISQSNRETWIRNPREYNGMRGKKHTDETRRKISGKLAGANHPRGMLGKKHTEETKQRIALAIQKREVKEESKRKMSEKVKASWDRLSSEERASRLEVLSRGRRHTGPQSIEHRQNRIAALKRYWDGLTLEERSTRGKCESNVDNHHVVSVEPWGYEDVYDMEVEGTHNFVANEVVVHNSTQVYHALAECQRIGGMSILLESEYGFEPSRLMQLGIDINDLLVMQPKHLEEAFEMIEKVILLVREEQKFQGPLVIALDSIAGLPSSAEESGDYADHHMASGARVISQALRKLMWIVAQHKVVLLFVNQFRHSLEKYGDPYITAGGMSIGYRASVRLRVRSKKGDTVVEKGKPIGTWIEADAFKNKLAVPFKATKYYLSFDTGIDPYEDLWRVALQIRMVKRSGALFKLDKDKTITREAWPDFLTAKFKDPHTAREFLTKQVLKRGLMAPYNDGV